MAIQGTGSGTSDSQKIISEFKELNDKTQQGMQGAIVNAGTSIASAGGKMGDVGSAGNASKAAKDAVS